MSWQYPQHRAWLVAEVGDGVWMGRRRGRLPIAARETERGPLSEVLRVLQLPHVRQGLPIIVERGL